MSERRPGGHRPEEREAIRSPQLLTPEVHDKIVQMVRLGNYGETACKSAGIMPEVYRSWLLVGARMVKKGEIEHPCSRLSLAIDAATGMAEAEAIVSITAQGRKDWRALAWRLERMFPKRWGQRVRLEVAHAIGMFLDRIKAELPRDVYLKVCEIAAEFEHGDPGEGVPEDLPAIEGGSSEIH